MTTYTVKVDDDGDKFWCQNGNLHRTDGPAVEYADGTKEWYQNDKLHRADGPAVEWSNGSKHWYQNGKRHRADGPAVECPNGTKMWFLEGIELTEAEWRNKVNPAPTCDGKVVEVDGKRYKLVAV